jgi:hypothetical protein
MVFLLAGKPSGRTTLTGIDRILHTPLPETHANSGTQGVEITTEANKSSRSLGVPIFV